MKRIGLASVFAFISMVALSACDSVSEKHIESGRYLLELHAENAAIDDLRPLVLDVDVTGLKANLTQESNSPQELTLTATEKEQWFTDCFTMQSHTLNEVYLIAPDPLVVEGVSVPRPILTTKCGSRLLVGTRGEAAVEEPILRFTELNPDQEELGRPRWTAQRSLRSRPMNPFTC